MTRRTTDAANQLYKPIDEVILSDISFPIFGSMTWTVAETKKRDWEEVRKAYIGLTGDTRDDVNRDWATNVVAGQLQFTWAKLKGREDLLPNLEANQKKRIEFTLTSTQPVPKERKQRSAPKRPHTLIGDQDMSAGENEDAPTSSSGPEKQRGIPTRGSMGTAAQLIQAGERDITVISAKVAEAHPGVKNVQRHVSYVAKLLNIKLTKSIGQNKTDTPEATPVEALDTPVDSTPVESSNTPTDEPTAPVAE